MPTSNPERSHTFREPVAEAVRKPVARSASASPNADSGDAAAAIDGRAHPLALSLWSLLRDRSVADKMLVLSACERRLGIGELSVKQEQAFNAVTFAVGDLGHVPHASEYDWWRKHTPERGHFPSASFVRNAFGGSWPAVRALFETTPQADARVLRLTARGRAFSNEELYEVLRAWADDWMGKLGYRELQEWLRSDRPAAVGLTRCPREAQTFRRFSSLGTALLAAGVEDTERFRRRGRPQRFQTPDDEAAMREKLLDGIREWSESIPGALLRRDFTAWLSQLPAEHHLHGLHDVRDVLGAVLGSWSQALAQAGLEHRAAGAHATVPGDNAGASIRPAIPVRAPRARTDDWDALASWVRLAAEAGFGARMSQSQYEGWRRERLEAAHREGRPLEAIPCGETLKQLTGSWFTAKVRAGVPGAEQYAREGRNRLSYTEREVKDAVRAAAAALNLALAAPDEEAGPDGNRSTLRLCDYERWRAVQLAEARVVGTDVRLPSRGHVSKTLGGPFRDWAEVLKAARADEAPTHAHEDGA